MGLSAHLLLQVSYTDFIGDEKRDIAEYTALGSLGSPWTMLTYTRASK